MTRPWKTVDAVETPGGELKLLERGPGDFMITLAGRIVMVSQATRSERELARLTCRALSNQRDPHLLIGGLGMGYTLRAALDELPKQAKVTVAELHQAVIDWCRAPLAGLTDHALADLRVRIEVDDAASVIARAAKAGPQGLFDAILLDLYEGPNEANLSTNQAFYGPGALQAARAALRPDGLLAVWGEDPDRPFEKRLLSAGFDFKRRRPDGGGRRHVIYLARRHQAA